ncbi:DUF58 domain-containing protein [Dyella dinghuensis]|uniref:DUF58 domain-containing protein n=1 Tax=Dyella dinghuensis TaxID=1920169 RepID=A0A3S0RE88_9GAMM|nr:DUF58 domain-containing protein [Dyella dinghuensis]RUL64081.1 DUF58 domain-containing protein [Dyella dinghuensis]
MNAVVSQHVDGNGRVQVSLSELIALRSRVARMRLPPRDSRATHVGAQSSRLYGRGMDYAESRAYQPGDDVRRLDWRLTARSGRLHTKLFQEEREGQLLILMDQHASMRFGTRVRFKSVQAARAAALAAWYAVRAGERVGLMTFGGNAHLQRPRGGTRGALDICGALARCDANPTDHQESLSQAFKRVIRLQQNANRVLLISDGQSAEDDARDRMLELMRHTALRVLIVADALELNEVPAGYYPIEHHGERHNLVLETASQREAFQKSLGAGQAKLMAMAQSLGVPYRVMDTAADPLESTAALLLEAGTRR